MILSLPVTKFLASTYRPHLGHEKKRAEIVNIAERDIYVSTHLALLHQKHLRTSSGTFLADQLRSLRVVNSTTFVGNTHETIALVHDFFALLISLLFSGDA